MLLTWSSEHLDGIDAGSGSDRPVAAGRYFFRPSIGWGRFSRKPTGPRWFSARPLRSSAAVSSHAENAARCNMLREELSSLFFTELLRFEAHPTFVQ